MIVPEPPRYIPSGMDDDHFRLLRDNVRKLMRRAAVIAGSGPARLLDVAPQDHEGARPFFHPAVDIVTFDIDFEASADIVGDICTRNPLLDDASFDYVVCTEVLEHTLQPFAAVEEMTRVLKPAGRLFLSVPFNFRIHGPLPDCWRFTEHGLRALLGAYEIEQLDVVETPHRPLMPIHYALVARKAN